MTGSIKAEARTGTTKSALKELRAQGKIPGVVYGKKLNPGASISIDAKELIALLRGNPHAVIEMDVPQSGKLPVMVTDVQRDKINRNLLHIDFHQINMDEKVKTLVRLEPEGDSIGEREGGMLQVQLHELEIRCLPNEIPAAIPFDVTSLTFGDSIFVKDLQIPPGIEVKSDPNEMVATVLAPQKEISAEEKEDAEVEEAEEKNRAKEALMQETGKGE